MNAIYFDGKMWDRIDLERLIDELSTQKAVGMDAMKARDQAEAKLVQERKERDGFKATIDAVISASKWDGVEYGLAQHVEHIRIERDEAQQWIDSDPDWKEQYNRAYLALTAERDTLREQLADSQAGHRTTLNAFRELLRAYQAGDHASLVGVIEPNPAVELDQKLRETEQALDLAMDENFTMAKQMGMQLDAGPSMRGAHSEPAEEQLP